ncbi:MAG: hypothetical protein MRK01_04465 [Candidatus Scalindua sp.]|nr:hypothetical protein [Candidatus Scalindua sp.]
MYIFILMPRKPRIEYDGGYYHVMSRGNRQEEIYQDDAERESLRLLSIGLKQFGMSSKSLESLPRDAPEKRALVWYIRSKTTAGNDWLSEHIFCVPAINHVVLMLLKTKRVKCLID